MPPKKARLSAEAAINNILRFVENDEDNIIAEEFHEKDDNCSDLDELFGENCKFCFLVINQIVIPKKPKAKKVANINYTFLFFYIKHNYRRYLLLMVVMM